MTLGLVTAVNVTMNQATTVDVATGGDGTPNVRCPVWYAPQVGDEVEVRHSARGNTVAEVWTDGRSAF